MLQLTLQQLFGKSASQDSQQLIINKTDLPKLTASASNTAESLLIALILHIRQEFEGGLVDELGNQVVDESEQAISYDQRQLYEKVNVWLWKTQFINNLIVNSIIVDIFLNPPLNQGTPIESYELS